MVWQLSILKKEPNYIEKGQQPIGRLFGHPFGQSAPVNKQINKICTLISLPSLYSKS